MVAVFENRPAYVTFEYRAEEDRERTISTGHYVAKDVAFAIITPQGTRDRVERRAEEWLAGMDEQVNQGRIPLAWAQHYRTAYKAWLAGYDIPPSGTPVANWPAASPAQVSTLRAARILTVEDLANASEEAIMRLGMGGRALKERAQAWLTSSSEAGKAAEELNAVRVRNTELQAQVELLQASLAELQSQVKALTATQAPVTGAGRRL